jgi:hypothetical protein
MNTDSVPYFLKVTIMEKDAFLKFENLLRRGGLWLLIKSKKDVEEYLS